MLVSYLHVLDILLALETICLTGLMERGRGARVRYDSIRSGLGQFCNSVNDLRQNTSEYSLEITLWEDPVL